MGLSDANCIKQSSSILSLLGLGFWVQGLRCFPWMAVNFFLKDGLNIDSSNLQLLQNSANLPMVAKPLYGILSDAVYIGEQHRIPYIAFGALLQAVSWIAIAVLSSANISLFTISIYLLLSNFGASIAEVANDAIVAEVAKQPSLSLSNTTASSPPTPSRDLQSFAWMASSFGGLLGNLVGGIAIEHFSARKMFLMFGILLAIQFLITLTIHESSLALPRNVFKTSVKEKLSELLTALRNPELAYSISWFAASYAAIPVLTGTMFFYQTDHLKIESSVFGISKVCGQIAMLLWSIIYNQRLKSFPARKVITAIQSTMSVFMISDVLFVKNFYRKMGVPDSVYVVLFSGILEVLFFFKILPFSILIVKLCPPGCEGSVMAFVMSAVALSFIVSGYLGVALVFCFGVTGNDLTRLPLALSVQAACTLVPLWWSHCIPLEQKYRDNKKEE